MTSSTRMYIEFHPWIFLYIFVNFMETELATNSHTVFYHFSPRYEITKFWMIRQCLSISDAISDAFLKWVSPLNFTEGLKLISSNLLQFLTIGRDHWKKKQILKISVQFIFPFRFNGISNFSGNPKFFGFQQFSWI